MERYIGLDIHQQSCTAVVVSPQGKRVHTRVLETDAKVLREFVRTVPRNRRVCFEEGTQSEWLYEVREVPLLEPARRALARLRERNGVRRVSGYVWACGDGRPRNAYYKGGWADHRDDNRDEIRYGVRTRAGITRPVRWHDLRHTCASHLVQGSWGPALSLYEVAQWLGHSSVRVTERYAHLCPQSIHGRARHMRPGRSGDSHT